MPRLEYEQINWEDAPSNKTPINAENLNNMDNAIAALFSYLGELEQLIDDLSQQDATNMTATFGEPGEEGVDEAPLQRSGSSIGNIVTGIHSRIRALKNTEIPELKEDVAAMQNALPGMISDKIDDKFGDDIGDNVTDWLTEHVDPVGSAVVVDDTLTIEGAAADAKKTGDEITSLKEDYDGIGTGKYVLNNYIVFEDTVYDLNNRVVRPFSGAVTWCFPLKNGVSYTINVTNRPSVIFGLSNTLYSGEELSVDANMEGPTEYVYNNQQNYSYLYVTKKWQSTEYGVTVSYPFWLNSVTQGQMITIDLASTHIAVFANNNITPYIAGYVVASTGNIVTGGNFRATDFIDIAPAKNIIVMMPRLSSSTTGAGLAFYDTNKNYINDGGIACNVSTETTAEERIIKVPQNARYIRTTVRSSEWDGFYAKQDDIYINASNIKKINDKASTFGVQMFAKIGMIGDSISCGWAKDKNGNNSRRNTGISWVQQMARRLGCTAYNLGASGVDPVEWFQPDYEFAEYCYTQYQSVNECDLYIIGLGLNPTSTLGSISDINQSDYTQNAETFYGQYARIIQMINAEHPNAIVICVTEPTTRIASTDQAVRNICALSFINANLVDLEKDYFDLFNTEEIISERQPDGLHYTPYGYSLLADAMTVSLNDYISKNPAIFKYVGVATV